MTLFRPICVVLLFAIAALSSIAQDNSQYFDDGGASWINNVIKINATGPLTGEFSVHYERLLFNGISLEVGAGSLFPFVFGPLDTFYESDNLSDGEEFLPIPDTGYSLYIHPKIYLQFEDLEMHYVGLQYRKRIFTANPNDITVTDYTLNYGLQQYLGKRVAMDYNLGMGYRDYYSKGNEFEGQLPLAYNLTIRLGFRF